MTRVSSYLVTDRSCQNGRPLEICLEMLGEFCDQVVVIDAGSDDGTWELLESWRRRHAWLETERREVDRSQQGWAHALSYELPAAARAMCDGEYCWHASPNELPSDDVAERIDELIASIPKDAIALALPRHAPWRDLAHMTLACPMRVCLSRNVPEATHGVVLAERRWTHDGRLYVAEPADDTLLDHEASSLAQRGQQLVHAMTHERCAYGSLLPPELELVWAQAREATRKRVADAAALLARDELQLLFNAVLEATPSVFDASLLLGVDVDERAAHESDLHAGGAGAGWRARLAPIVRCGKVPPKAIVAWLHDRAPSGQLEEQLA